MYLPVLDTGDKRQTGQAPAPRELTACWGGQTTPTNSYYNMGRCEKHTQKTQVARGGEASTNLFPGPLWPGPQDLGDSYL